MTKKYYYCENVGRVPVDGEKILCKNYKTSELQTWCSLGRLPCGCCVEADIARGEEPALSGREYFRELLRILRNTRRDILRYQRELACRNSDIGIFLEKVEGV